MDDSITERSRTVRGIGPVRMERRSVDGGVIFVGLLAAGLVAMSYPATIVAVGIVAMIAWILRQRLRSGIQLTAIESFAESIESEAVRERVATRIAKRGQR